MMLLHHDGGGLLESRDTFTNGRKMLFVASPKRKVCASGKETGTAGENLRGMHHTRAANPDLYPYDFNGVMAALPDDDRSGNDKD